MNVLQTVASTSLIEPDDAQQHLYLVSKAQANTCISVASLSRARSMSNEEPNKGDEVAWNWGSSHIEGEVVEKTDKKITKEIKGKPITKNGEPENPAYFVKQTKKKGNPVVKKASELELLESKGDDADDKQEADEEEDMEASTKKGAKGKSAAKGKDDEKDNKDTSKAGKQSNKKSDKADEEAEKADGKKSAKGKDASKSKGKKAAAGDKHERDEEEEEAADNNDADEGEEKADSKGKGKKAEPKQKKVKKTPPPTNQHVKTRAQVERKKKQAS